jgi:hypothetical protein
MKKEETETRCVWLAVAAGGVLTMALGCLCACSIGRILPAVSAASRVEATRGAVTTTTTAEYYGPATGAPAPAVAPMPPSQPVPPVPPVRPAPLVARVVQVTRDEGAASKTDAGAAQGVGAEGDAVKMADTRPPVVSIPQGPVATGGTARTVSVTSSSSEGKTMQTLYVLGALVIMAGAAIAFILKQVTLGIEVGATGAAIIGLGVLVDRYPWVFIVALALAAVAGAYVLYVSHKAQATAAASTAALKATVAGVQAVLNTQPQPVADTVVTALRLANSQDTKATITQVKTDPAVRDAIASATGGLQTAVSIGAPSPASTTKN